MRPRAFLLIRNAPVYRREAFAAGLEAAGYEIHGEPRGSAFQSTDVLVIWNRYGRYHDLATRVERQGARVLVAENGPLGRDWRGEHWYSLVQGAPAGAGSWPNLGPDRWDSLNVSLCDWRKEGNEIIILAQRGIGPPGVAQPHGWHLKVADILRKVQPWPVRIREHPGEKPATPLEDDLAHARYVVTWASAAGLKALVLGVPVVYGFAKWIGADAGNPWTGSAPRLESRDRLPMFRRLAWSMYRTHELATGQPFHNLLTLQSFGLPTITAPT